MILKFILQFILGFGVGLYGYLIPSYINLGVFQASMDNPMGKIHKILLIIAFVEIPYCFLCMNGMQWIMQQKILLLIIKWAIVVLLIGLSIVTFINAKKESSNVFKEVDKTKKVQTKKLLVYAIFNPFQLSAWAIWGSYFIEKTWFEWTYFSILIFSIGASAGVYVILFSYAMAGQKLLRYFSNHKQNINYTIALLLFVLGIFQFLRNIF